MTVIVYRDGVMAADSGGWSGDSLMSVTVPKVFSGRAGIASWCGSSAYRDMVTSLVETGDATSVHLHREGDGVVFVDRSGNLTVINECGPALLDLPFYAVGSADAVALGALHMGASAEQACEIAIKVGPWAAGAVQVVRLADCPPIEVEEPENPPIPIRQFDAFARWRAERGLD